jgi:hypothetical protein
LWNPAQRALDLILVLLLSSRTHPLYGHTIPLCCHLCGPSLEKQLPFDVVEYAWVQDLTQHLKVLDFAEDVGLVPNSQSFHCAKSRPAKDVQYGKLSHVTDEIAGTHGSFILGIARFLFCLAACLTLAAAVVLPLTLAAAAFLVAVIKQDQISPVKANYQARVTVLLGRHVKC